MTNQFYKMKILVTGSAIVPKGRKTNRTPNAQHRATKTSQSVAINSPKGSSNTHDPFKYSVISVF